MVEFTALDVFQVIAAISAAIAAGIAILHTKRTQHQVENSLRPWIGVNDSGIKLTAHGILTATLRNHGTLPAQNTKVWTATQLSPFTKDLTKTFSRKVLDDEAVIMPNAQKSTSWIIPEYDRVVSERLTVYLLLRVEYEYANQKKSTYYYSAHYNPATPEQGLDFEFLE